MSFLIMFYGLAHMGAIAVPPAIINATAVVYVVHVVEIKKEIK